MRKIVTNNLLLKIISVIIAVIVWLLVANINDPMVVKSYQVPVNILNSAYIESGGMTYLVEEEEQMATVILKGNSSVVEGRVNDISAVADLTQIVDMNTTPVMVPITATCEGVAPENITVLPKTMAIQIEELESRDFTIAPTDGETTPDVGYEVGALATAPEKVKISGPASLIQKIDRVIAEVNVTRMTEDATKTSRLKVIDKNQEGISDTQMRYLKFDIGEPVVDVHIDLWTVRDEVKLKAGYVGSPAYGYQVADISVTPETISVAGTEGALSKLAEDGYTIELPESAISVNGQREDFETKLNLADFMPEDLIVANANEVKTAIVQVSILPVGSKQMTLQTRNIEVQNLDEDLRVVFDTDKLVIGVKASDTMLSALRETDITMSVDMREKAAGDYEVPVNITLPAGCELLEPIKTLVHISALE